MSLLPTGSLMTVQSYRDLQVWRKAVELAVASYGLAKRLPATERGDLGSQIRRAAVSVPANIAEGCGRSTRKTFRQYLRVARGSLVELETLLLIATRAGLLAEEDCLRANLLSTEVGRMLTALLQALEK